MVSSCVWPWWCLPSPVGCHGDGYSRPEGQRHIQAIIPNLMLLPDGGLVMALKAVSAGTEQQAMRSVSMAMTKYLHNMFGQQRHTFDHR